MFDHSELLSELCFALRSLQNLHTKALNHNSPVPLQITQNTDLTGDPAWSLKAHLRVTQILSSLSVGQFVPLKDILSLIVKATWSQTNTKQS